MSKLVAVQRMNVLGHLVTKWINPNAEQSSKAAFPVPAAPPVRTSIEAQRVGVSDTLTRAYPDVRMYVAEAVHELQENTIAYLHKSLALGDGDLELDEDDDLAWEVAYLINEGFEEETLVAFIALREVHDGFMDDMEAALWVEGLHTTGNNREPLDPHDPESVARNGALLKFCMEENNEGAIEAGVDNPRSSYGSNSNHHTSQGIAHFVYDNPERADEIREFVDKNYELIKDRDSSGIEMFMNDSDEITALSEGKL